MELANVRSLYEKMIALAPVRRSKDSKEDFRTVLSTALGKYLAVIKLMKDEGILTEVDVSEIEKTNEKLNDIVASEYKGLHSTAFAKLTNLLMGDNKQPGVGNSVKIEEIKAKGVPFYRMRVVENRRGVDYKDMFHIPLTMRGKIPTNRFSSPGYPCLYLGTNVYACWEEMGRPMMSKSMVSRYENQDILRLVDIRIPTFEEWNKDRSAYIRVFPLLIACSVEVKESEALFKPEYIVPHLLMDFIIYNNANRKGVIHGLFYTSVFKNDDFMFGNDKFENVAIPVQKALTSKTYCTELCRLFKLTNPTCDEIEQARTGGYISIEPDKQKRTITIHQGAIGKYPNSSFGNLEKRLNNESLFPLKEMKDE